MNRKQFVILLSLVLVVGAAGLIVRERGKRSWKGGGISLGQKLLPDLAVNDITQVAIKAGTNELNLARRDDRWRVRERGDYPANFSEISDLLLKFSELKIVQSQEVGDSQLGRFELLPPGAGTNSGTLVEFKDQSGKTLNTIMLGKKHMKRPAGNPGFGGMDDAGWPDGRYVMVGTGAKTLAVISDPLDNVQAGPEQWLDKGFLSIEKPRTIAVQYAETTNSWKLIRASETNDWQLADAKADEQVEAARVSGVTRPFSSASFNDVAPITVSNDTHHAVLTVETFDGFTYVAKISRQENENYPVSFSITADIAAERVASMDEKVEDKTRLDQEFNDHKAKQTEKLAREKQFTNWIYHIPTYTVDSLLKSRGQLLAEAKKDETPKDGK